MNMEFEKRLPIPKEVKEMYPVSEEIGKIRAERDIELKKILSGEDKRKVLIVGPCSADREDSVLDYLDRLKDINEQVKDKIFIIPRVYTNKPRTNGDGYKGMLHQPDPNGMPDLFSGIVAIREMHKRAVEVSGMTCADEMLYPENYRYLNDLLGYVAVGARSVENQQHRMTASGIAVPVGMKNPTGGDFNVMLNAINAAQHKHDFIYRNWAVHSQGNPYAHAILRGYMNKHGQSLPNYHYEDLLLLQKMYGAMSHLTNQAVIIDCNHSNSNKQYLQQPRILKEVMNSCMVNPEINNMVKGFMVESYIEDGNQKPEEGVYGKSITDACLGIDKTRELIFEFADMVDKQL
ncbi:MAG: 3-deoxy-7-phosphoheptulonate synthase [Erysipelotrichaceae bacterium]|nr:3-deoxy-7-phosphoheptulonate synthase [Erysipelotrichaceae bacterium]